MHVAAQEEEEDTEEEEEDDERALREERARALLGEAPTMTVQEYSDVVNRVCARASARAAQPAFSRVDELGDEIRVEGTRVRALEFKAKEAFLARSGLSGQALEAEEMRLMRLREGASFSLNSLASMQRLSVVLHTAVAWQTVNELACGDSGIVHGAKCIAVLNGVA